MRRIVVDNYIRIWSKHAGSVEVITERTSEAAARKVRDSCENGSDDFEKWARLIRANCVIPPEHPFRSMLRRHGIPASDHLWTLGAIAFGTENPWIAIREIDWGKGEVAQPEEDEKTWLNRLAKTSVLSG